MKFFLSLSLFLSLSTYAVVEVPAELSQRHIANCPQYNGDMGEYMMKESYKLNKDDTLFVLGCEMYAYNTMERAYIVNSYGDIQDVAVAEVSKDGDISATSSLMGAGFVAESLSLVTSQRGRGLGDCGSSAEYKYSLEKQVFVLIEARVKDECDGNFEDEWPVVYKK